MSVYDAKVSWRDDDHYEERRFGRFDSYNNDGDALV